MSNPGGHFQIYVPGRFSCTKEESKKLGITELMEEGTQTLTETQLGPDGKSGYLLGWEMRGGMEAIAPNYNAEKQTWFPAQAVEEEDLAEGRYWYGFYNERPVTPETLQKEKTFASMPVTMCDGNEWLVPIADFLPHTWTRKGKVIKKEFENYSNLAQEYFDKISTYDQKGISFQVKGGFEFCCLGLALNYRITEDIVEGLKLIDDDTFLAFAMASVELDVLQIINDQKKTEESELIPDG